MRSFGATELPSNRLRLKPDGGLARSGQIANPAAPEIRNAAPDRRHKSALRRFRPFRAGKPFSAAGFRAGIAALLIAHLLVIAAMAASPSFHEWLHHDADHDDHDCAVTLFLSGGVHSTPPPILLPAWIPCFAGNPPDPILLAPTLPLIWSGILEHAPPAVPAIG